ncbi:hypothetical protein SPONN_442 [uncultured Candidatus Thioglobus sp.]|nr:hypothetical protein SPONN_442 [uncultured Candidatus Thioglobus sp.]
MMLLRNMLCVLLYQSEQSEKLHKCGFIEFPNHPQMYRRTKCNAALMKQVKCGSKYQSVPKKVFLYNSIIKGLTRILKRPGVLELCNKWRLHAGKSKLISDIFDGKVWKEFNYVDHRPFLDVPNNIALSLNIDWFNPYEHTEYSIGAIYFAILNLPRTERYKIENVIIAGLIPGPNEPSRMNPFLAPVTDDLLKLWTNGIQIPTSNDSVSVRAALLCFTSDIPATRKVCGFPGFRAKLGCSKCLKVFPCEGFGEPTDYSGFAERQNWKPRTMKYHRESLKEVDAATTASGKCRLQKTYGVQYSELTRLSYLNIVRNHVIDPMHNMYLGTAKLMIKVWKDCDLLKKEHLLIIQQKVNEFSVPYGIGRIPYKIGSNFSGLTADQWLNWTNLYSIYALNGILRPCDIDCWSLFVDASVIFHQYTLTNRDIAAADEKLFEFCIAFERLYGKERCTPNMHLHMHIKDCALDFGPIAAFWAFPFERFNGILESFSKNWVKPEEQIMRKFHGYQELANMRNTVPEMIALSDEIFSESGSLHHMQADCFAVKYYRGNATCNISDINAARMDIHDVPSKLFEKYFTDTELEALKNTYSLLYPDSTIPFVPRKHTIFYDVEVLGEHFLSRRSRSERSAVVMAYWNDKRSTRTANPVKAGVVEYFFMHTIALNSDTLDETAVKRKEVEHIFARVKLYSEHPRPSHLPYPLRLVSTMSFESDSYIPVSRLLCRSAISSTTSFVFDYGEDNAFVVCPHFLANAYSHQHTYLYS